LGRGGQLDEQGLGAGLSEHGADSLGRLVTDFPVEQVELTQ